MPLERSRQLIGGVWRYVSADQSDNGGSQPGVLVSKQVLFAETAGAGTYTAEIPVTAGTVVLDVLVALLAVFDADTMAYTVQDGSHFYFNGRTLSVAYDPTGPNALSYASLGSSEGEDYAQAAYNQGAGPGGGGGPLTTAGQGVLYPTSDTLTCTVETTGTGGTTGRLFVNVLMLLPIDTAAVVKA